MNINRAENRDRAGQTFLKMNWLQNIATPKQTEAALRQSEARNRALLNAIPDLMFWVHKDGTFLQYKASDKDEFYVSPDQFLGKKVWEVLPKEVSEQIMSYIEQALQTGCTQIFEYELRIGDRLRHYEASVAKSSEEEVLSIVRNISARKQTEMELLKAKEVAEAGSRSKSEFLATMSHELRTPLNAILGLSQLLAQGIFGELNAKQMEYITSIYSSGEHLLLLINDILDLSKVEAGKEELLITPISVPEICQSCLCLIRETAFKKGLVLTSQIDPQVKFCMGDERRVKQMLLNLLSNAIKFTPAGKVELIVRQVSGAIAFTVEDTGIGIAEEDIPSLFQPFSQVDKNFNRQYEGTGLGLVLTRKLARLHGGDVTVRSILGKGSQFTLSLPDKQEIEFKYLDYSLAAEDSDYQVESPNHLLDKRRILIMQGDLHNACTLQDYLQAIGCQVKYLLNSTEFLEKVKIFQPNLIILDLHLADGISGLDLLAKLRQEPNYYCLPVVILSNSEDDRENCLIAGANSYFTKPIGIPQIESILIQFLD